MSGRQVSPGTGGNGNNTTKGLRPNNPDPVCLRTIAGVGAEAAPGNGSGATRRPIGVCFDSGRTRH